MLSAYPACFIKESNGYSVVFPDLNYLATCGADFNEALAMAVDCLAGYLFWLEKDGEEAPQPTALEAVDVEAVMMDLMGDAPFDLSECFVNMVAVDVAEYARQNFEKTVRKNLTIPAWLNQAALEADLNFSQVLQEALQAKLLELKKSSSNQNYGGDQPFHRAGSKVCEP